MQVSAEGDLNSLTIKFCKYSNGAQSMFIPRIEAGLAQLSDEINTCENILLRLVKCKKNREQISMEIKTINRKLQHNPIAIVGMASIFPQAKNLQEYWQNIVKKTDCITDVPPSRWNVEDYYDPNPKAPEKTYCKRGGFIPDIDFDPMQFGLPPNILEVTDISQLLSLVVAKEAMEDAGYGEGREFNRETTGVVLGVVQSNQLAMPLAARLHSPVWEKVLKSSGLSDEDIKKIVEKIKSAYVQWDENAFPGMLANVVAGRIANRLNLGGINCVVDAACASSLGALKLAVSELVEHRCDIMLTGGVDTNNSIITYMCFSKTPAISPSGSVKPFDAESDGMMLGEGIGMVVLKRFEDAERDNDKIYAIIKGIGTSSDGRYKSIYAPRKEGQVRALRRAYEDAGCPPESVGLIEAHGTGTMAGDPTEFASLRDFFGERDSREQHIALGTVKSQIGHTKAAAGAASLIKTALALHHKILPPTLNITQPHPKLNIKNSPFYLNTETKPWIRAEGEPPRRAGASSFGFGGTNFHVVLEEYQAEHSNAYRLHHTPEEVLLFAHTSAQLLKDCEEILTQLQSDSGDRHYAKLVDVYKSREIPLGAARVGFVADSRIEACKLLGITIDWLKNKVDLTSWEHPQGIYYRSSGIDLAGKVVALFSGQGSQYLEMGRELVMNFPELRRLYGYMDSLLLKDNLQPLSEIVFPPPAFEQAEKNAQHALLQQTEYTQPALGVLSAGLYKILQQAGFKPDFVAGHSFGELTALWAAGVFSEEDYWFLAKARGQAMAPPQEPNYDAGAMLAVKADISKVEAVAQHFPQVRIANLNSPRQVVLAGKSAEIAKVQKVLQNQGATAVLLPVVAAFHTPLVEFAWKSFARACKIAFFTSPKIPVYTNVTGKLYPKEPEAIQKILENQLSNSVLFQQEIENIYAAGGYCFVEFGPRRILTNLVKDILGDKPHLAVALNPSSQKNSDHSLREAVVQLRVAGLPLKNFDPYQVSPELPAIEQKQGLKVSLSCTNYVSEKTKMAFEKALQDGHQVKLIQSQSEEIAVTDSQQPPSIPITPERNGHNGKIPVEISATSNSSHVTNSPSQEQLQVKSDPVLPPPSSESKMPTTPDKLMNYQRVLEGLEYLLVQFQQHQGENLQLHEQYLNYQMEYIKIFFHLMQQQNSLFASGKSSIEAAQLKPVVMDSLERSMMQFHAHQGETLRVHEQYLQHQVEYKRNFFQTIQQEYFKLLVGNETHQPAKSSQEVTIPCQAEAPTATLEEEFLSIGKASSNSQHSHFAPSAGRSKPAATQTKFAEADYRESRVLEPAEVGKTFIAPDLSLRTDFVTRSKEHEEPVFALETPVAEVLIPTNTSIWESNLELVAENSSSPTIEDSPVLPTTQQETNPELVARDSSTLVQENVALSTPPEIANIDLADLGKNLLAITSDKTGYPVEMLELDMDLEADLGIDSIKRVEILGVMQELYSDLPQPNLEELAEKRTIGQIVEYLQEVAADEKKKLADHSYNQQSNLDHNIVRSPVKLKTLCKPDFWDFTLPEGHISLLTDDGSSTTSKLAHALIEQGWKVIILSFPQSLIPQRSPLPVDLNRVVLADLSEEHLQQQLAEIATNYGPIGAFIHLNPVFDATRNGSIRYLEVEKTLVKHVFLIAKHLKKSLNEAAHYGRSCFCTVARLDGAFGLEHKENFGPISAGLFGLTKSLNWEWQQVFCRAIDLSPTIDAENSAHNIIAELHDPNLYLAEVAYGSQGRVTLISTADSEHHLGF